MCDYERDHINLRGVIADSFHHDTGTAFKNIAKKWRQNRNDRHRDVSAFSQQVFNDNKYDLSSTVQVLRHALIPPQSVACIQKIINKSLYMGEIAHEYLMRVKKYTKENATSTVPNFCIYTAYVFSFDYEPQNPKPTATVILNFDYAFWDSNLAQAVWLECFETLTSLNIDFQINHWTEFFTMIDAIKYKLITTIDVIKINLMIYVFQVIYNFHKHMNDKYANKDPMDHFVDNAIEHIKYMYDLKVRDLIFLTPLIHHKLKISQTNHVSTQTFNERDRQLIPLPFINYNSLTQDEVNVFNSTWCICDRVQITDSKLNVKPYRYEPP